MDNLTIKKINSVIFDIDGTLFDSNDEHARSWHNAFNNNGIHIGYDAIRELIGMGSNFILSHVLSENDLQHKGEQINNERKKIFREKYLTKIQPFSGIISLFERIKTDGKKIILASASHQDIIDTYLEKISLDDYIDGVLTANDVQKSKPSPEIFIKAIEKYSLEHQKTVVVGDSPYDIIAAKRLDLPIIITLTGGFDKEKLIELGADETWEDLHNLYTNYEKSLLSK